MVTHPDQVSAVPPLAGIVFCDLPLNAEGIATGSSRLAGSARWAFEPHSVGGTVVEGLLQATRAHGYTVPEGFLFRAGQVFYHAGQIAEVRLTGLLPTGLDPTGALAFTTWSTPTPPTLTVGPHGEVRLEAADAGKSFIAALAVPAHTASPELVVACLWDLQTSAPQAPGPAAAAPGRLLPEHRVVLNPAHYQALREILAQNTTFSPSEDTPWPTAPIATGPARGLVQLRPVTLDTVDWMSPEETDRWAARMWEQRKELSDLDADALDALCALWLSQAQRLEQDVLGDIDALLAMRGLQPKRNGAGEEGGYRPEQRAAMWRAILHVQNLWVHLSAVEVYQRLGIRPSRRRRQPTEEVIQSRVFSITDRLGHQRPDGFFDVEKFFFRPGKIFAHFLFGAGRQTALLAAKALHYDPVQQTWEKRLARYLSYQWRCKAHGGNLLQPFKVTSLLAAVGATLNRHDPARTRARLEQALETLLRDHLIAAWQYEQWDEAAATRKGWSTVWLQATMLIEPPDNVRQHYQHLAHHEAGQSLALPAALTLGAHLRQHRQHLGLTLTQAAEQLEVSPSYLHRLEQGHRGKRLAAKFQQRVETWLKRSLPQEDGPSI